MTKEMLNELRDFELFVEKLEEVVEAVRNYHLTDDDGNVYRFEDFDLRDDTGSIDTLPTSLEDYLHLWRYIQERYNKYILNQDDVLVPDQMFLDVYWNDEKSNSAYYDNVTLWIYFDKYGIFYNED